MKGLATALLKCHGGHYVDLWSLSMETEEADEICDFETLKPAIKWRKGEAGGEWSSPHR